MSVDPSVILVMRQAVEKDPSNNGLRLHFASLLMQAGDSAGALEQAAAVLAVQPDNLEALRTAASAAESVGDPIRANGYRKLIEALSWNSAKGMIEEVAPSDPIGFDSAPPREAVSLTEIEPSEPSGWETERPEMTLADVAGMEEVKRRLHLSFLGPMRNPDLRKLYGKSLKGGLLLYGPPGCGKTYLARAVAGELGARFLSVALTDVVDMWLGESEKNLHEIFETARHNRPCVLFFDEIDALARKRSLTRDHAGRNVINQLLAELDGVDADNEGVYVLAATNQPWDVDPAIRRPGRLDRTVLVLPPDQKAREVILRIHLRDRPVDKIDYAAIAARTEELSGADMAHICETASEYALEDSIVSGNVRPISMKDMQRAIKEVKSSVRPWLESARNYATFANEDGTYDELVGYLRKKKIL